LGQWALDDGRIGLIAKSGVREVVNTDGSVELGVTPEGEHLKNAALIPARLGGGFLFWGQALYRARSFTGPLQLIAADLPTNVVGASFGPTYVLLSGRSFEPMGFTLDPPQAVELSPPGVTDVVASADGRALALDKTGQAFASTDAGKIWRAVTASIGAHVYALYEEQGELAFVLAEGGAWLQRDGRLARRAFAPENVPASVLREREHSRWVRAFGEGLPLPGHRTWFGDGRDLVVIDLLSGSASGGTRLGASESSCAPVSLEDEGLVVCVNRETQSTNTVVLSHALGAAPVIEKTFPGAPRISWGQGLSVLATCSGTAAPASACARGSGGTWAEFEIPAQLLEKWVLLFWVPRETGGLAAVLGTVGPGATNYLSALFEPQTGKLTPWDTLDEAVGPSQGSFGAGASIVMEADGGLRGYTATRAIAVDPNGHVSLFSPQFASISSAGAHALARDDAENLWQSSDYGAHWRQIARPLSHAVPESFVVALEPRPSGRGSRTHCSPGGCVLEHPSGTGMWIRAGWPEDPPREQ